MERYVHQVDVQMDLESGRALVQIHSVIPAPRHHEKLILPWRQKGFHVPTEKEKPS